MSTKTQEPMMRQERETQILELLRDRHFNHDIRIGSRKGLAMESDFMAGVMAGAPEAIPPVWAICIMSGRSILETVHEFEKTKNEKTKDKPLAEASN